MAIGCINVVREILSDKYKGKSEPKRCSPFNSSLLARHHLLLNSFQCTSFTEYEFVDTDDPAPGTSPHTPSIYSCSFGKDNKTDHLLAVGGEDGHIAIIDSSKQSSNTTVTPCCVSNVHQNAVMDVSWVPGTDDLVSGGGDKTAVVWQLRGGRLHPLLRLLGHTRSVKAVAVNEYDPMVFASGSRDSNIIVWDRRCSPNYRADEIVPAHPWHVSAASAAAALPFPRYRRGSSQAGSVSSSGGSAGLPHNNGVTSLVFTQQHSLVSAGASDGLLKVWDLRRTHCTARSDPICQHTLKQPHTSSLLGFSWLSAQARSHYVYALAMDHNIYAYHLAQPNTAPVACYSGGLNQSYYVKCSVSDCGRFLVSGGSDHRALLWLTGRPGPPAAQLSGHHGEVTAVAWGRRRGGMIATCSDDFKQKIFYIRRTDPDDIDENLFIRGRAESVDKEVLERCPTLCGVPPHGSQSLRERRHRALSSRPQTVSFMPQTPSSRSNNASANINNDCLLQTPSRVYDATSNINDTPQRPIDHSVKLRTPMRGNRNNQATMSTTATNALFQRSVLSTPRQIPFAEQSSHSELDLLAVSSSTGRDTAACAAGTPETPCSVERSVTLLQWLSSTKKTPSSVSLDETPRQSSGAVCVSASKRAGIKRKLTEVLEDAHLGADAENRGYGGESAAKRNPLSPTKVILGNIGNEDCSNQASSAAKMLKYEKYEDLKLDDSFETRGTLDPILDMGDSVQPFETSMMDTILNNSLRSSFGETKVSCIHNSPTKICVQNNVTTLSLMSEQFHSNKTGDLDTINEKGPQTPNRCTHSKFESPTANLPNFIRDGTSPCVRPVPVFHDKAPPNWLNSLSLQRQLKFSTPPDKKTAASVSNSSKKSKISHSDKSNRTRRHKKYLKIVALTDSPMRGVDKSKKMTQTTLNFRL